jgi:hypothetical protein
MSIEQQKPLSKCAEPITKISTLGKYLFHPLLCTDYLQIACTAHNKTNKIKTCSPDLPPKELLPAVTAHQKQITDSFSSVLSLLVNNTRDEYQVAPQARNNNLPL